MLDQTGFDLWADDYDNSVGVSDEDNTYPFAGYKDVLERIFQTVLAKPHAAVLDIGFGTGTLTAKLYEHGCVIYGQDFSTRMIELAGEKMPGAHLYQGDFAQGLAEPLLHNAYDFIIATYSFHHLTDDQKITLLHTLQGCLKENGQILIGDVAFATREQLERCRETAGEAWDDEEFYFVFEELQRVFPALSFTQVSHCAGILTLSR